MTSPNPPLSKEFKFFRDQGSVDSVASGAIGVAAAGGFAAAIGFSICNAPLAAVGLAVELGTVVFGTPLLATSVEKFKPKNFLVSSTLALTGIFGLSAALHASHTNTQTQSTVQVSGMSAKVSAKSPLGKEKKAAQMITLKAP